MRQKPIQRLEATARSVSKVRFRPANSFEHKRNFERGGTGFGVCDRIMAERGIPETNSLLWSQGGSVKGSEVARIRMISPKTTTSALNQQASIFVFSCECGQGTMRDEKRKSICQISIGAPNTHESDRSNCLQHAPFMSRAVPSSCPSPCDRDDGNAGTNRRPYRDRQQR